MTLTVNGKAFAEITTNRSMTVVEALYSYGYDINDADDMQRAYDNNEPFAYVDDNGNYCADLDAIEIVY